VCICRRRTKSNLNGPTHFVFFSLFFFSVGCPSVSPYNSESEGIIPCSVHPMEYNIKRISRHNDTYDMIVDAYISIIVEDS
jgi:hypothetical protein